MNLIHRYSLGAAFLIFLMALQALLSMRVKSLTNDEVTHIPSGYSYLRTGDFRLNPEHPPLAKMLAAFPLLWIQPRPILPLHDPGWTSRDQWQFAREFFEANRNRLEAITFWARIPMVLLGVALGCVVYRWASQLYGSRAGLLSLFFLAFEPNILAHTRLVTTDMAITLLLFVSLYRLWVYCGDPRPVNLLWAALAFAMAQASKFSALILIVLFGTIIFQSHMATRLKSGRGTVVRRWAAAGGHASLKTLVAMLCVFVVSGVVLFVSYGGRLEDAASQSAFRADADQYIARTHNPLKKAGYEALKWLHVPYRYYLEGFRKLMLHFRLGHPSYVLGRLTDRGVWYYFPLAMLIKVPIPLLFFFGLGMCAAISQWRSREAWFFLYPVVLIFGVSVRSNIQIGIRHLLPIFPFLMVMAGAASDRWLFERAKRHPDGHSRYWSRKRGLGRIHIMGGFRSALALLLAGWLVISSWWISPHYLSYFNELIGGPKNGHLYLVDSNLDWGQDLKLLKAYMDRNHIPRIRLFYFGSIDPDLYGIDYETPSWLSGDPPPGIYAVSANWLYTEKFIDSRYDYFRHRRPQDRAGYSILIYNVP
ncbi:MAG: glycosyltransferase family 39 protein [Deltaproteobacteria bacterium]|nr:glycosyltransferase family 39 protein [Deltaproteobacteria bacterium]